MRRFLLSRISTACALCVLAGCAGQQKVDPEVRPAIDLPAAWSEPGVDTSKAAMPDAEWWRRFGSDELSNMVVQGQHNNFEIAAAISRVREAQLKARIAGASLLPQVDFAAGANRQLPLAAGSATTSASGLLEVNYEVDFWGGNKAGLTAAEAGVRSSIYDRETVNLTVTCGIVSTYLQVLSLRDRLSVARIKVTKAQQVLTLLQSQSRAGAASSLDIARQRSVIANQQADIPSLQQQEHESLGVLAILLGQPPQNFMVAGKGLADIQMPLIAPGLPSELLSRRPDIQSMEAQLVAANANIAVARAALFPSIYLTGATGGQSNALLSLFNGPNLLANFGASLVGPIFNGNSLRNARDLAVEQKQEMIQVYRETVIRALSEVDKSLSLIDSIEERYKLKQVEVEQASYAFNLSTIRYREGAEDLMTVIDTERSLSDAQSQLGQIKLDRLQATVSLYKALGGGWHESREMLH
jgi:NodT family efflux transporter outer membrane factor (OMF) lipoprotein